jgi:O6-methylguanine-DNA--protein-cysteine methyltransferase
MAGETFSEIFYWEIKIDKLHVSLASTDMGAARVGIGLEQKTDGASFFRGWFPHAILYRGQKANIPLIRAVRRAFQGKTIGPLNMDLRLTNFQRRVLKAIARIPFGETMTYGDVAGMIGKPKACRAVGQVMGKNPLPLIYP